MFKRIIIRLIAYELNIHSSTPIFEMIPYFSV